MTVTEPGPTPLRRAALGLALGLAAGVVVLVIVRAPNGAPPQRRTA